MTPERTGESTGASDREKNIYLVVLSGAYVTCSAWTTRDGYSATFRAKVPGQKSVRRAYHDMRSAQGDQVKN